MSCGGGYLGFPIGIKNSNLVKDIPMIIHLQFGFSQFISFREEDLWNFSQEGERNSKNFFNLERRNYINKSIQTLVTDSGHTVSKFTDVLNEQNKLYSSLYSNKETEDNLNVHLVDKFFPDDAEIPKLNEN